MKRFLVTASLAVFAALAAVGSASVQAANLSFTGSLAGDNDVQLFNFALAADADVTLRTWSYAGGTNAAGNTVVAGGFDPVIALFSGLDGAALLIDGNDDGLGVAVDPVSGQAFDSLLQRFALPAGDYTVALTQVANFANGPTLGDGFLGLGSAGFDGRTAAWALDLLGVDRATRVPEPGTLVLALLGLAAAHLRGAGRRPSRVSR